MRKILGIKAMLIFAVIFLLVVIWMFLLSTSGLGEGSLDYSCFEDWIGNTNVAIDIVDRVSENGTYTMYYSVGEEFVIRLDRDVVADTGWISMSRGGINDCRVYYECDWVDYETSQQVIDELVSDALNMVGEK